MNKSILINKDRLPKKPQLAVDLLYEYFNGFDLECIEYALYYEVELSRNDYTYCEDISDGLLFLGINKSDILSYCVVSNIAALCLSENWLPYAYAVINSKKHINSDHLTIIHVDDHSDLMSPFIYSNNNSYYNLITKDCIDFNDALSVKRAVESGAITIGSMLTPIIYSTKKAEIFHIKHNQTNQRKSIVKSRTRDDILNTNNRIAINYADDYNKHRNKYILTSDWEYVIKNITANTDCLLHIDMDYFNNRFNASTSWEEDDERHDLSFLQQTILMDRLIASIEKLMGIVDIKCILIGISPSFYPVEYWKLGLEYLITGLKKIGLDVDNLL